MKPVAHDDGSFSLTSAGRAFGDPGFYFVVHGESKTAWARYILSLQESIHVYSAEQGTVRADHLFRIWGKEFLRLHYRMRKVATAESTTLSSSNSH